MTAPQSTGERLASIEAKLDALLDKLTTNDARVQVNITDHESRIRRLERAVWIATGAATAAGGTVGAVAAQLMGG